MANKDQTRRELILVTIDDLVTDFLYYQRQEDEGLPKGAIEEAIKNKELAVEDMVIRFRRKLIENLKED